MKPIRGSALAAYPKLIAGGSFARGADTEVELPALRYPTGYTARVSGARVLSAPDANLLRLENARATATVTVIVAPAGHHPVGATRPAQDCPAAARYTVHLRRRRIERVAIYVDGQLVAVERGRRIALPRGLADGTVIRLEGRRFSITRRVDGCRLK